MEFSFLTMKELKLRLAEQQQKIYKAAEEGLSPEGAKNMLKAYYETMQQIAERENMKK
jgi:hypothetical protein